MGAKSKTPSAIQGWRGPKRQQRSWAWCGTVPMLALLATPGWPQLQAKSADTAAIVERLRAGAPSEALELSQTELRSFPRDCRLLSLQGVALQALGRTQDALGSFKHVLAICPGSLAALEGAAQLEFAAGDPGAVRLLTHILAMQPADPTSHAMLASLLARQGECAAALPHFEASRALFAAQPDLLGEYGSCLARSGKWSQAATVFAELSRDHPSDESTYDLAIAQGKAGQPKDALGTLEPLINRGTEERAMVLGSSMAEDAGDTPRAVSLLRSAILLQPDDVDDYVAFARLADAHGSFQVGIDMIDAGLTRLPDKAALYVSRGVLRVQLSQIAEAEADFEHAHQLDPKLSFAMDAIGILETQKHENAASMALFRQQAKLHPEDPLLQYLFAEALSESSGGNLEEAIAVAKRACTLEPGYEPALDLLATLYLRANQPALAVREADLALAHDPSDSIALFAEIRAKHKLGDEAEVPALLKRLELAKKGDLARAQQLSRYRLTEVR